MLPEMSELPVEGIPSHLYLKNPLDSTARTYRSTVGRQPPSTPTSLRIYPTDTFSGMSGEVLRDQILMNMRASYGIN